MRIISSIIFTLLLILGSFSSALAFDIPSFPTCSNTNNLALKASYSQGTHGIAGNPGLFEGSDSVYDLSGSYIQCFCATDGNGIQTNWWKISSLNQEDLSSLSADGWIFIPSGSAWGLTNDPYLAKNNNYSCKSSSSNIGGVSDQGSQQSSPNVLGLASTGGVYSTYFFALISICLIAFSFFLKSKSK